MKLTNRHHLPEPVVKALSRDTYSRGRSDLSVTQIIGPPRIRLLRQDHEDEITEDVTDQLWSTLGRAAHLLFERTVDDDDQKFFAEERLFIECEDWTVSGAIDLQEDDGSGGLVLRDYKVTSVWSIIFGKSDWEYQLNCYAYLARVCKGKKVTGLKVLAILRDWHQSHYERGDKDYPSSPIMEVVVPLWPEEEQERYFKERVRLHQDAEYEHVTGGQLPECSREERWQSETKYAVMKEGRKKAVRVFESIEEANEYLEQQEDPKLSVSERPGEAKRCTQNWCRVADWCEQYQWSLM